MSLKQSPIYSSALKEAIDPEPLVVTSDTSVEEVLAMMSQLRSSCLLPGADTDTLEGSEFLQAIRASCALVVEKPAELSGEEAVLSRSPKLLGIFTERDIVRLAAVGKNLKRLTVAEVMTPKVITLTLSETQDIFTALSVLRQHRIRHLPIINPEGQLLGIVTPQTIRRALQPANIVTKLRYVKDVMSSQVVQAPATNSVLDLAQLMARYRISCVVITEPRRLATELSPNANFQEDLIPVGIVTERDIVQFQALGLDLGKMRSSDVMSAPLFCLQPEDTLWFAHEEMQRRRVRRLVVAGSSGELLGIVSQTSLLQALEPTEMYGVIELLQRAVEDRTKELKEANEQLEGEVEERRKAEAALQKAHDELQKKVAERTAELQKANELLKEDIARREQVEAALRESEAQSRSQTEQLEKTLQRLHATQIQLVQAEKMSSLGQLVAGIAHEINNPVNFIYGNLAHANQYINEIIDLVNLFREHYPQPEEEIGQEIEDMDLDFMIGDLDKILNSMSVGADRIRSIVVSLRNFSRLDEAEMKEVDIHEGLESTLLILQHRLGENISSNREIQVIKEYGNLPLVECYPGLLNQVFINILTNALDALESQSGERAILIHTSIGHGELGNPPLLGGYRGVDSRWELGNPPLLGGGRGVGLAHGGQEDVGDQRYKGDKADQADLGDKADLGDNLNLKTQNSELKTQNSELEAKNSKLEAKNSEEFIVIRIADNGPGMTEEVRNRLFEPFFTTKSVGKGTGLGLSISYQIVVEKHGGQIECISAPGRGTEFRVEIPLRQSAPRV